MEVIPKALESKQSGSHEPPKDENYDQFQLSLSIRLGRDMESLIATDYDVLGKIKRVMSVEKVPISAGICHR